MLTLAAISMPLKAASPGIERANGLLTLSNEYLKIEIDEATGLIKGIVAKETGLNLTPAADPNAASEMWALFQGPATEGKGPFAGNWSSGRPAITTSGTATQATATLSWTGTTFTSGTRIAGATFTVTVTVNEADRFSHWRFAAHGLAGSVVPTLVFPVISGIRPLGGQGQDNLLLLPDQGGRLVLDPIANKTLWARVYPSAHMSMQMTAFYNAQGGFLLGTRDTEGQTKQISWLPSTRPANTARWAAEHFFPEEPADELVLPYEVVIGVFQGDWTAAADLYRAWALQQSWVRESASRRTPSWFRQIQYGTTQCVHGCGSGNDGTFAGVVSRQAPNTQVLGDGALAFVIGWEKLGAWFYGDALPPYEGWAAFDQMVNALHQQGNFLRVCVGAAKLDSATPLWTSGSMAGANQARQDGTPITESIVVTNVNHTWYQMSPASPRWRQHQIDQVRELAAHGVDSISWDGWPIAPVLNDYSAGHTRGMGGTWYWRSWKELLKQAETAALAVQPDITFSTEEGHELLLPYVTFFDKRDITAEINNYSTLGSPVPLLAYVYKPFVQSGPGDFWLWNVADKPDSYGILAFARALIWGEHLPFQYPPLTNTVVLSSRALNYYRGIGRVRAQFARFLIDGTMLPPPAISSPQVPVVLAGDGLAVPDYSGTAAAIQASAWKFPGEVGLVMTNIGTSAVSFSVPIDFSRLGLVSGASYTAMLTIGTTTSSLGAVTGNAAVSVTLQPQEIGVVVLAPTSQARQTGAVTEFFNSVLSTYFITADSSEAAAIDSGSAGPGWRRTGYTFKAGGATPVCRFFGSIAGPNSHFYTVDPNECAELKRLQATTPFGLPRWNFESLDFFTTAPANQSCPPTTVPVYRAYNNGLQRGVDSNHRINSNLMAIAEVAGSGWVNEGVVMCAPQ